MVLDYAFRIKMAKTGTVTVIADVGGKLHSVSKEIKVTIGDVVVDLTQLIIK